MPNIKYCRNCRGMMGRMKRIYIRENKPIIKEATEYPYIDKTLGYKRQFNAIGWVCENCGGIILDNKIILVPFEKYHILEFDYNQLLKNFEKYSLEQE